MSKFLAARVIKKSPHAFRASLALRETYFRDSGKGHCEDIARGWADRTFEQLLPAWRKLPSDEDAFSMPCGVIFEGCWWFCLNEYQGGKNNGRDEAKGSAGA